MHMNKQRQLLHPQSYKNAIFYLSRFTVNCCNISVVLWQPTVDISAKWSNKFHLWRIVIIKWVSGNPLLEFFHIVWTLRTPAQQNSKQWIHFTVNIQFINLHKKLIKNATNLPPITERLKYYSIVFFSKQTNYSRIPLLLHLIVWHLRKVVPRPEVLLYVTPNLCTDSMTLDQMDLTEPI